MSYAATAIRTKVSIRSKQDHLLSLPSHKLLRTAESSLRVSW